MKPSFKDFSVIIVFITHKKSVKWKLLLSHFLDKDIEVYRCWIIRSTLARKYDSEAHALKHYPVTLLSCWFQTFLRAQDFLINSVAKRTSSIRSIFLNDKWNKTWTSGLKKSLKQGPKMGLQKQDFCLQIFLSIALNLPFLLL